MKAGGSNTAPDVSRYRPGAHHPAVVLTALKNKPCGRPLNSGRS